MKKVLSSILTTIIGIGAGAAFMAKISNKVIDENKNKVNKFRSYYEMLNRWLVLKLNNEKIETYFLNNGYKKLAIYGMGEMGNRLLEDLTGSDVEIVYGIDKNISGVISKLEVFQPDEDFPEADVIVVTAVFDYDEIQKNLSSKCNINIISIEDVIYGI